MASLGVLLLAVTVALHLVALTINAKGMALCRGDVKPDICRGCINDSSLELSKLCPNQKEAVIWLKKKAASGGCHRKFARGNRTTPSCQTIYALVQCTPDLSEQQCIDCLNNATALIPTACAGKQGCRVIAPSCNFRKGKKQTVAFIPVP
ncbi:hypothetical protein Pint_07108 [Pistacia integerrima]|uniref:Uncharacterized protein n=1 Tax=Pistacia integerrima TaxID=434235 RepID=A0ACC0XUN5_9ROSI|nr:hypothetical protein Pint_07108 [Pistacia integerrima]